MRRLLLALAVVPPLVACSGKPGPADTGHSGGGDTGCDATVVYYVDGDGDGYGDDDTRTEGCDAAPSGSASVGGDCDDTTAEIHPGVIEVCDYVDNDCDGEADEPDAQGAGTWYEDLDGDTYGDPNSTVTSCTPPSGFAASGDDCDDTREDVYPGAAEVCGDGVDQDCSGDDEVCA